MTGRGVPADPIEAAKWIRRAADQGESRAQFNLAAMYDQGRGVQKDPKEAAKWMRKAADQGLAAGQFGLGSMYAHGRGVPQNLTEAVNWYRKAADQDDPPALNNLAYLLATSDDRTLYNPSEAVLLAQKAVDLDPKNAIYLDTLATVYFKAGQRDKAVQTERQALDLNPDNASYKESLAKYLSTSH